MSVWKKSDSEPSFDPLPTSAAKAGASRARPQGVVATIGPSIAIQGDVTGEEDLLIEGRIQGTVQLRNHSVTVGEHGQLKARILAKSVTICGSVEGDLLGEEEVVVRPTGSVLGNIRAPRVSLESGCRFKGSIDMEKAPAPPQAAAQPASQKRPVKREAEGARDDKTSAASSPPIQSELKTSTSAKPAS